MDKHEDETLKQMLFQAIKNNQISVLSKMAEEKYVQFLNSRDDSGRSTLYLAISQLQNPQSFVQMLLQLGVDVNDGDDSWAPLHLAVYKNLKDIVQLLLKSADVNQRTQKLQTVGLRRDRWEILPDSTPLHMTLLPGCNPDITQLLLRNGAKVNSILPIMPLASAALKKIVYFGFCTQTYKKSKLKDIITKMTLLIRAGASLTEINVTNNEFRLGILAMKLNEINFIDLLLHAGYNFLPLNKIQYSCEEKEEEDEDSISRIPQSVGCLVDSCSKQVNSLQDITCSIIRQLLVPNAFVAVRKLNIPNILQKKILLE